MLKCPHCGAELKKIMVTQYNALLWDNEGGKYHWDSSSREMRSEFQCPECAKVIEWKFIEPMIESEVSISPEELSLKAEEFTLQAIDKLRVPPYKGIHTVFSGFNTAFREYFPGLDPVKIVRLMAAEGKIVARPAKRGAIIYKPDEAPKMTRASEVLNKILGSGT